jgi:hypothetical protein
MELKPYRAFGYLLTKNTLRAGEKHIASEPVFDSVFSVGDRFPYVWLYTKGSDVLVNVDTQEQIVRNAGDSTFTKPYPKGAWRTTMPEDLELWCISAFANPNKKLTPPEITIFSLGDGLQKTVVQGTKLFIASGSLEIDSKTVGPTRQISFVSGDKTVTAVGDVYGFMFA